MKIINKFILILVTCVIRIFFLPVYLFGFFVPKNNNIWIFGSWKGFKYNDNTKALFEYVIREKKEIRAIWITKSSKVLNSLKEKGYEVYKINSIRGIYYGIVSGVIIFCAAYSDIGIYSFIFPWRKKIIQLWHGTPLKRLDSEDRIFSITERLITFIFIKYLGRPFDLIVSATDLNFKVYPDIFNIPVSNIKITGQPRNDELFIKGTTGNFLKILYIPTWREYNTDFDLFEKFGFDVKKIDEFLKKNRARLFLKFHMNESKKGQLFLQKIKFSERIKLLEIDDIYDILGTVDILITDYSSVYFDFLLLNRPIIFAPFDLKIYEEKRGLYYNYEAVTPGLKAQNWTDIMTCIEQVIVNDTLKEARKITNEKFNHWRCGNNSERVFREIINILKK